MTFAVQKFLISIFWHLMWATIMIPGFMTVFWYIAFLPLFATLLYAVYRHNVLWKLQLAALILALPISFAGSLVYLYWIKF